MENILLTFLGAAIGIVVTILVGRYYFQRSVKKALSVYIHLSSPILLGIDSTVRQVLKTYYRDIEVLDLFQLQFLIANDGERAIRDVIEPLSFTLPEKIKLLDATVLYVHPKRRIVEIASSRIDSNQQVKVQCDFKLLNKGEFFLIKLLTDGSLEATELMFEIVADDLPPVITPKYLPPEFSSVKEEENGVDWAALLLGTLFFLMSVATFVASSIFYESMNRPVHVGQDSLIIWLLAGILVLLTGLCAVAATIAAIVFIIGRGLGPLLRQKPRYVLPKQLAHNPTGTSVDGKEDQPKVTEVRESE